MEPLLLAASAGLNLVSGLLNRPKKPSAPATEKTAQRISLQRYNMARQFNKELLPDAARAASADITKSVRGRTNTQMMMNLQNPFLNAGNNAPSASGKSGVPAAIAALSNASLQSRGSRFDRMGAFGGTLDGQAQQSTAGLTDLSTIASNSAIRQLERDIERRNAINAATTTALVSGGTMYQDGRIPNYGFGASATTQQRRGIDPLRPRY